MGVWASQWAWCGSCVAGGAGMCGPAGGVVSVGGVCGVYRQVGRRCIAGRVEWVTGEWAVVDGSDGGMRCMADRWGW